ncbi:hypothetical protein RB195_013365 [Necator americanus]|uniref:Uncharacterized protein n=1 Tax=Necator americanus TaxID=51031 RepID=A0ABR1DV87_NECAM
MVYFLPFILTLFQGISRERPGVSLYVLPKLPSQDFRRSNRGSESLSMRGSAVTTRRLMVWYCPHPSEVGKLIETRLSG